jgi:hypothetical protein
VTAREQEQYIVDSASLHREQGGLAGAFAIANRRYRAFLISERGYESIYWRFIIKKPGKSMETAENNTNY